VLLQVLSSPRPRPSLFYMMHKRGRRAPGL